MEKSWNFVIMEKWEPCVWDFRSLYPMGYKIHSH